MAMSIVTVPRRACRVMLNKSFIITDKNNSKKRTAFTLLYKNCVKVIFLGQKAMQTEKFFYLCKLKNKKTEQI